jgi:hypothetical protein
VKALLERLKAGAWPPRCSPCGAPMTLERDTEVCALPAVFETIWVCSVCGGTTRRCRVFEAIH